MTWIFRIKRATLAIRIIIKKIGNFFIFVGCINSRPVFSLQMRIWMKSIWICSVSIIFLSFFLSHLFFERNLYRNKRIYRIKKNFMILFFFRFKCVYNSDNNLPTLYKWKEACLIQNILVAWLLIYLAWL